MDRASQVLAQGVPPGVPDHTVPLQITVMSLALPSIIVLADDTRWKRRPKDNSTSQ